MINKDFIKILEERSSIREFDKSIEISESELSEILALATKSPSAWNLQHWKFIVVKSEEAKQKLLPIAFNQKQVLDAAATVIVLGNLKANDNAPKIYNPIVDAGLMTKEYKDKLISDINNVYTVDERAKSSAILNSSLAAMQFMLAAKASGWDTCPMTGFNHELLVKEFNIDNGFIPVIIIPIGKAAAPSYPTTRLPINDVTEWV
ncbi:nitroreductase family protein [Clostridium sp. MB05]|uniref:nitroreductase family protein n=1 Tax=Clostridium sp. MB05 TaxID=3376682 RepID=UPI003981C840